MPCVRCLLRRIRVRVSSWMSCRHQEQEAAEADALIRRALRETVDFLKAV